MKHETQSVPEGSAPVVSDHRGHVLAYRKSRSRPIGAALDPRRCDACGGIICCFYGQKTVERSDGPSGVWILHPSCTPASVSGFRTGDTTR